MLRGYIFTEENLEKYYLPGIDYMYYASRGENKNKPHLKKLLVERLNILPASLFRHDSGYCGVPLVKGGKSSAHWLGNRWSDDYAVALLPR